MGDKLRSTWHAINGDLHPGSRDDCAKCARLMKRGALSKKQVLQRNGSRGGKASNRNATRHCTCGRVLKNDNKSGMCLVCLREWRKQNNCHLKPVPKGAKAPGKPCVKCGKDLSDQNTSGYCAKCWRDSPAWRRAKNDHSGWVGSIKQEREARERDRAEREKAEIQ